MEEVLEHFSHNHPLILCQEREKDKNSEELCFGCSQPVGGSTFSCSECNFFLHESCARFPKSVTNSLHKAHPLTLIKNSPYGDSGRGECDLCDGKLLGLIYHCSLCKFDLHIKCALPYNFEPETHKHSFINIRPTSFVCDTCGVSERKGISALCITCQIWVHPTCARLPHTVKQIGHQHQLSLTYCHFVDLDDSIDFFCKICCRKVNKNFSFYYCSSCRYIAHIHCATQKVLQDETPVTESGSREHNQVVAVLAPVGTNVGSTTWEIKETGLDKNELATGQISCNENHRPIEVEHFSHHHKLTLSSNDEMKTDEVCDGCVRPLSVPFYSCGECSYFLHKHCVELLGKILHPLHPHPLNLRKGALWTKECPFRCNGCQLYCNGFFYTCDMCKFFLDVGCAAQTNPGRS